MDRGMGEREAGDGLVEHFLAGRLKVSVYESRRAMGEAAAASVASRLRRALDARELAASVFASAPSQNEFLEALAEAPGVDWSRISGFHLDEYLGMDDR